MSIMSLQQDSSVTIAALPRLESANGHPDVRFAMGNLSRNAFDAEERRWQLEWSRRNIED